MKISFRLEAVLMGVMITLAAVPASGQQTCAVTKPYQDSAYEVKIDSASYIAITKQEYIKLEDELTKARDNIKRLNEIVASLETIKGEREKQINDLNQLNNKHQEYAAKLELADQKCEKALKACIGSSRLTLDVGAGVTKDSKAAGIVGAGYGIFRVWGFFQSGSSAALAGVSVPLF